MAMENDDLSQVAGSQPWVDRLIKTYGVDALSVHQLEQILYAASGHGMTAVVKQVLNSGSVYINMLGGRKGETCLWIACSRGRAEVVEALLAAPGIAANLANKEGYTPLHAAALDGHAGLIEPLLRSNADVDHAMRYGRTPLYSASWKGHDAVVEKLIAAGANVDMVTEENASALTVAAYYGKLNSVLRLLKASADTTVMNGLHKTPADVATSQGNSGIANVIRAWVVLATMPRWSAANHRLLPRGIRLQVFAVMLAAHRHGFPGHHVAHEAAVQLLGGVKLPKEMWLKVLSFLRPSDFFSLDRVPLAATPTADELQAPDAAALVPAGV